MRYFEKALHNFTMDAASLGAVRHLADLGLTVAEIEARLDFPTPHALVRQTVWEALCANGTILTHAPDGKQRQEKVTYVREYGKYGKATFRQIKRTEEIKADASDYVRCDFGRYPEEELARRLSHAGLSAEEQDYILGLPWRDFGAGQSVWHRKDARMSGIIKKLEEDETWHTT